MNGSIFQTLITILGVLALPVLGIWAYDKWVAAPKRPKNEQGEPIPGPMIVQVADWLLMPCIVALVLSIGVGPVFEWAKEVAEPLSWLAPPIGLWLLIDSWLFAPRRRIAHGPDAPDPALLRIAYFILPVLVVAVIVRMISAETLDFSLVLLVLSVATGLVWAIDSLFFRKNREAALAKVTPQGTVPQEPGTVDYARSFFPVAFIVLLVRAFIFEPFRIPSDSMMPTLLDGDFIVVNKYAYGLRWPVINEKFLQTGTPQRGDVVVFRYPPNPNINYIKRLVGLPGDHVEVHDDHLVINGETIPLRGNDKFNDGCYANVSLSTETLGEHTHQVMHCRAQYRLHPPAELAYLGIKPPPLACNRAKLAEGIGGYVCIETPPEAGADTGDYVTPGVIPAGKYLMIGDNRDNSEDGRVWGLVPDENLVGKATRIWFNFDSQRKWPDTANWRRIGTKIE
jgi:signal peptidase I